MSENMKISYSWGYSEINEERMDIFCNAYNFKSLVKEPTCFKMIGNPSCRPYFD